MCKTLYLLENQMNKYIRLYTPDRYPWEHERHNFLKFA